MAVIHQLGITERGACIVVPRLQDPVENYCVCTCFDGNVQQLVLSPIYAATLYLIYMPHLHIKTGHGL